MFESNRLLKVMLNWCIAFAVVLAFLLLVLTATQTALPVAALAVDTASGTPPTSTPPDTPTNIPTNTPTNTPLPVLTVEKSSQVIGDQNSNGSTDPGDTISYTITVKNIGSYAASDVVIQDDYDDQHLEQPDKISDNGMVSEGIIVWEFEGLDAGQEITVTYDVKVSLAFPSGKTTIKNIVTVKIQEVISTNGEYNIVVVVTPTSTPTTTLVPTQTPPPTITQPAAPTLLPASQSAGPTGQAINPFAQACLAFLLILVAMGGLIAFAILTLTGKEIPGTLRDGYILTLIMGTVIILGLAGSVERSAIAGLIGTVAGYVLRGVVESGREKGEKQESGTGK